MAKSPSGIAGHVAPAQLDIPPAPPLPVVPPVPPLPAEAVSPVAAEGQGSDEAVDALTGAAPEGAPSHAAGDSPVAESARLVDETVATPRVAADLPPLPPMSAEEAALRFETMPDAAEQATGLEEHEPLKFVWSKRWPFLTLVPATAAGSDVDEPEARATPGTAEGDAGTAEGDLGGRAEPTADDWSVFDTDNGDRDERAIAVEDEPRDPFTPDPVADDAAIDAAVVPDIGVAAEPRFSAAAEQPLAVDGHPTDGAAAGSADPEWADAAWTETAWDGTAWADSEVPASHGPIGDDVTIELLANDDAETEVFATEASTVVLPVADSATEVMPRPLDNVEPVPSAVEGVEAGAPVDRAESPARAGDTEPDESPVVLSIRNLSRSFGDTVAVNGIDLDVRRGSFYGIVGPNGAGKTTTLSMVTGLLRPDSGTISVNGLDVWKDPAKAKKTIGVLPDRLRLFDRLTGAQLLYYSGVLRGLDGRTVRARVKDLASAFGLEDALNRLVADYSAGMTKKVALASALIHSPRLLVLDEPFESVDPVSAANVIEILQDYVANGGTVVLSSHGMDLIQRVCDHVAIIVNGEVLDAGAVDDVRRDGTLEERFVELAGGRKAAEGMEWLHSFSD
ncbi:ABC transporter ATP-binding protein [Mycetocola zhujimingii]